MIRGREITVRSKILVRLRNLVIFEVFGVKFSARKIDFSNLPNKTSPKGGAERQF